MILTVGGEKGGPGKSTVATTLAAMRASTGRQVLLVNADAQSTSIHWATARRDHPEMPQVTSVTMRGPKVHTEIADMTLHKLTRRCRRYGIMADGDNRIRCGVQQHRVAILSPEFVAGLNLSLSHEDEVAAALQARWTARTPGGEPH